jgi:hypothetical protein
MCHYYCHSFTCKHVTYAFARFCPDANFVQTPCPDILVWQTIRLDDDVCDECGVWFPDRGTHAGAPRDDTLSTWSTQ